LILTALNIVLRLQGCENYEIWNRPLEPHAVKHQATKPSLTTQLLF